VVIRSTPTLARFRVLNANPNSTKDPTRTPNGIPESTRSTTMFPGETISTGASPICADCKMRPELEVHQSPGSLMFYLGTYCLCGPYSRESEYFTNREDAERVLAKLNKDPSKNNPYDHVMLRQP
jgi:hypothetical protein